MSFSNVHFDLDAYISGFEQARLRAYGVPLVVATPHTDGVVYDSSLEARRLGVLPGMPADNPRSRFPKIIVVEPDMDAYFDLAERVMDEISSVGVPWRRLSMSEAVLDVRSVRDRLGADDWAGVRVVERLRRFLKDTHGVSSRTGFSQGYLSAKIACDEATPDSVRSIDIEEYPVWWRAQRCSSIPGIDSTAEEKLARVRVFTLGDAANKGCEELGALLGEPLGTWLWRCSTGETDIPGIPPGGRKGTFISAGSTFSHDAYTIEQLLQGLMPIVASLCSRLLQERQHAGSMCVRLRGVDGPERSLSARCRMGREYSTMYNNAKTLLETLWGDTQGTISTITVSFEDIQDDGAMPSLLDVEPLRAEPGLGLGIHISHSMFGKGVTLGESGAWRFVSFCDKTRWVEAASLN